MNLKNRIHAFALLGSYLKLIGKETAVYSGNQKIIKAVKELEKTASNLQHSNGWFVKEFVFLALQSLGESLSPEKLQKWVAPYQEILQRKVPSKTVGVVMAGNVPAVGFHDFLTILLTGNRILAKLSSDDNQLIPAIAKLLCAIETAFEEYIAFTDNYLKNFDAIIATGSNNSARYFEYYFGKYPHVIRKNRNAVAVLTGQESFEQLEALSDDIFLYYGLGCRNVAKLFVPKEYPFEPLLKIFSQKEKIAENHKYFNNYEYNKAIFLVNGRKHLDTGNLLLVEDESFASPVSVLHYEYYDNRSFLRNRLIVNEKAIQCIVSGNDIMPNSVLFGKSQQPELWNYADGVDTLKFLLSL